MKTMPSIGDKSPDFKGVDQHGKSIALSDYRGKGLVLYFYPRDNTPGCTAEACSLRNGYEELQQLGMDVVGVSPDSAQSHLAFIRKHSLPFRLIADTEKEIASAFGVWGERRMYGRAYMGVLRTTFIIGKDGTITHILDKVNTKAHVSQILTALKTQ